MTQLETAELLMDQVCMHVDYNTVPKLKFAQRALARLCAPFVAAMMLLIMCVAPAAAIQNISVTSLTVNVDKPTAAVGELVELTIRAKIRENVDSVDQVLLPDMPGFQIANNEQHVTQTDHGTEYLQTISLVPQKAGHFEIGPVTIFGTDSSSGSPVPSKFVTEERAVIDITDGDAVAQTARQMLGIIVVTVIIIAFAFFFGRMWFNALSRKLFTKGDVAPQAPPQEPEPESAGPEPPTRLQRLKAAMRHAHREPTRQNALELRAALRDVLGAGPDETLSDITVRLPDGERGIFARALRAVERAAFIDEQERTTAIEDGLVVVEAARARLEKEQREHS